MVRLGLELGLQASLGAILGHSEAPRQHALRRAPISAGFPNLAGVDTRCRVGVIVGVLTGEGSGLGIVDKTQADPQRFEPAERTGDNFGQKMAG